MRNGGGFWGVSFRSFRRCSYCLDLWYRLISGFDRGFSSASGGFFGASEIRIFVNIHYCTCVGSKDLGMELEMTLG